MVIDKDDFSFAVFPYLKTNRAVTIGKTVFRSTEDKTDLTESQARALTEISSMLFLQDHFRIKSASYAVFPRINLDARYSPALDYLQRLQSLIAYCYSSPNEHGWTFLSFEHASLVIFNADGVPTPLVRPDFHIEVVGEQTSVESDQVAVPGYRGLFNFQHPFWTEPGSRIYPPVPHLGLNMSQNLASDVEMFLYDSSYLRLLFELLLDNEGAVSERVFTALKWFNAANAADVHDDLAILNLSVGFETLLGLPSDQKTDRLIDAIALLLGRVPRLEAWARQFYNARSAIVHEGRAKTLHFVAGEPVKKGGEPPIFGSLLSYGRQIFQLCVATLVFGAKLTEGIGLQERLISNQERFEQICKIFSDPDLSTLEKLQKADEKIASLSEYRFIADSGLKVETMLSGAKSAIAAFLEIQAAEIEPALKSAFEAFVNAKRSGDSFDALDKLSGVMETRPRSATTEDHQSPRMITWRLLDVVWSFLSMHFLWLKRSRERQTQQQTANN